MDKNLAASVQELISENKLEEALQLLISSLKENSDRNLNSLILLKGKLSLLKEQEFGGLLDFEEAAQERAKIAHSLLSFLSSGISPLEIPGTSPKVMTPVLKYVLIGTVAVIVLLAGLKFILPTDSTAETEETSTTQSTDPSNASSLQVGKFHFTTPLPVNQPFSIGGVSYTIQSAEIEKYADPVPPNPGMAQLTIRSLLIGKTPGTGGVCWREQRVRVLVDGEPYAPKSQGINGGWIELDSRTQDELVFAFADNGKNYELEFTYEDQVHRFPFAFSKK